MAQDKDGLADEDKSGLELMDQFAGMIDDDDDFVDDGGLDADFEEARGVENRPVSEQEKMADVDRNQFKSVRSKPQDEDEDGGKADSASGQEEDASDNDANETDADAQGSSGGDDAEEGAEGDGAGSNSEDNGSDAGEEAWKLGPLESAFAPHAERLKANGVTPQQAVEGFFRLQTFAEREPDKYLGWVAQNSGHDEQELLKKAGEHLGLEVTVKRKDEIEEEDDPFEDDEVKSLKTRLREAEAELAAQKGSGRIAGPGDPQEAFSYALTQMEADKQYPHFADLKLSIGNQLQADGVFDERWPTMQDLQSAYATVTKRLNISATPAEDVAEQDETKEVTAKTPEQTAKRKRAASKSIDGGGQGAARRSSGGVSGIDPGFESLVHSILDKQEGR